MLQIIQYILLGIVQGITEWLPISSSGMLTLVMTNFFKITNLPVLLQQSLFLHLGTFLAALVYFRNDVAKVILSIFKKDMKEYRKVLRFLIISTIITGIIGLGIIFLLSEVGNLTGKTITFGIGILLLITAGMQFAVKKRGIRTLKDITTSSSILAGLAQGIAALPGISRSGMTISTLLLNKFDDTTALRLSFLMSLPAVLLGNIFLNLSDMAVVFSIEILYGVLFAFIAGIITIHLLITLAKKINFAWFALIFGILMILSIVF
jgi:undecaprenyl-diphosphatase